MKGSLVVTLFLSLAISIVAQKKEFTLDVINEFNPVSPGEMVSVADGEHYTKLGANNLTIDKYSYSTGEKVATLLDLKLLKDHQISSIDGYEVNIPETRILIYTNKTSIYRRSFKADYYLYDIARKTLKPLSDGGQQQAVSFAPNGDLVAYVKGNNIHLVKIRFGTESRITDDGKANKVLNGIPDWNYEEEMTMSKAYEFSPDSKEIAYIKFNESEVGTYSYPIYKASNPSVDSCATYPCQTSFKYPKVGTENAKVSVHVFNINDRTTKLMDTGKNSDVYLPRIKWTYMPNELAVVRLNRLQNQFELLQINSASGVGHVLLTEREEQYIDPEMLDNLEFLKDNSGFVCMGEQDGYSHIYYYSMVGKLVNQVTKGNWDVIKLLGCNATSKVLYYQSAERSPLKRDVYEIKLDGKNKRLLSAGDGWNEAKFSSNFKYYHSEFSNLSTPTTYSINDTKGKVISVLEANQKINQLVAEYAVAPKEMITINNRNGVALNGWMMKPTTFDSSKNYPLMVFQYSGPNSQEVIDKWSMGWEQYLASNDVIVVMIDPTGTGARGEEFRKSSYLKMGIKESDDLIDVAQYLAKQSCVDASRIGIWGWSHGGYMTLMCMSRSDVFKMGISVAAPTDLKYYDTAYTERYMKRPFENGGNYQLSSPISLVKDLHGRLLLIHGTADDNVHFQNLMEYSDALIQADKQFDMFVYPNRNHHLQGGNTRNHLYQMMSEYIFRNL